MNGISDPGEVLSDPRRVLFRFPDAPLAVGESYDLIFWGTRPPIFQAVRVRAPGLGFDLDLEPLTRTGRRTTQAIAFQDATDATSDEKLGPAPR